MFAERLPPDWGYDVDVRTSSPRSDLTESLVVSVARKAGHTAETATAAGRRVLLIESDADGGEALSVLLEVWGHQPLIAETGRHGVQRATSESPDVIILDLGLDDMDGCEVVQQIRSEASGGLPVIVAYSGSHQREDEARRAGCDAFVLKPAVEELESLIQGTREQARQFSVRAGPAVSRSRQR